MREGVTCAKHAFLDRVEFSQLVSDLLFYHRENRPIRKLNLNIVIDDYFQGIAPVYVPGRVGFAVHIGDKLVPVYCPPCGGG